MRGPWLSRSQQTHAQRWPTPPGLQPRSCVPWLRPAPARAACPLPVQTAMYVNTTSSPQLPVCTGMQYKKGQPQRPFRDIWQVMLDFSMWLSPSWHNLLVDTPPPPRPPLAHTTFTLMLSTHKVQTFWGELVPSLPSNDALMPACGPLGAERCKVHPAQFGYLAA